MNKFFRLGSRKKDRPLFYTNFPTLDRIIGPIRGGSILQLLAENKNGKTSLAYAIIAANQGRANVVEVEIEKEKALVNAVWVDVERTYDEEYAKQCGVDIDKLLVVTTDYVEDSMIVVESLLAKGLQLFVYDSVPASLPKTESEKDMDDSAKIASAAGLLSRWMIRLIPLVDNANALFIMINQYRANMSPMARSDKKAWGARALQYYSTVILELVRIKNEDGISTVEVKVTKNKLDAEGKSTQLYLVHGEGFDIRRDKLTILLDEGIVQKSGSWFVDTRTGNKVQGIEKALEFVNDG